MYHIEQKGIRGEGKLAFYGKIKTKYNSESYLNIKNLENRKALRDIRMSTHKLNIETGRYKKISRELRICEHCSMNKIETEEHFILECPAYNNERQTLYGEIGMHKPHIEEEGIRQLKEIFDNGDIFILNKLGKFIKTCFYKRNIEILGNPITGNVVQPVMTQLPSYKHTQGGGWQR